MSQLMQSILDEVHAQIKSGQLLTFQSGQDAIDYLCSLANLKPRRGHPLPTVSLSHTFDQQLRAMSSLNREEFIEDCVVFLRCGGDGLRFHLSSHRDLITNLPRGYSGCFIASCAMFYREEIDEDGCLSFTLYRINQIYWRILWGEQYD